MASPPDAMKRQKRLRRKNEEGEKNALHRSRVRIGIRNSG